MKTMRYGLLGGKLGHSLSPQIHARFFHYTGIQGSYELLETAAADVPGRLRQIRAEFSGCNVTIPHKLAVMPLLDSIAPEAQAIGAVNTIAADGGRLRGYNTDYFGFGRLLAFNGIEPAGKTAAVLGSGGAARAVVKYLADARAGQIYLVTRAPATADAHFLAMAPGCRIIGYEELAGIGGDLLVNCTPVGMYPQMDAAPVGEAVTAAFDAAVDLIYNPARTLFLRLAASRGKKYANGLFMLVAQAVAAQEIWQGREYDSELIAHIAADLEQSL